MCPMRWIDRSNLSLSMPLWRGSSQKMCIVDDEIPLVGRDRDQSRFDRLRAQLGFLADPNDDYSHPPQNISIDLELLRKNCWMGIPHIMRPTIWRILSVCFLLYAICLVCRKIQCRGSFCYSDFLHISTRNPLCRFERMHSAGFLVYSGCWVRNRFRDFSFQDSFNVDISEARGSNSQLSFLPNGISKMRNVY